MHSTELAYFPIMSIMYVYIYNLLSKPGQIDEIATKILVLSTKYVEFKDERNEFSIRCKNEDTAGFPAVVFRSEVP